MVLDALSTLVGAAYTGRNPLEAALNAMLLSWDALRLTQAGIPASGKVYNLAVEVFGVSDVAYAIRVVLGGETAKEQEEIFTAWSAKYNRLPEGFDYTNRNPVAYGHFSMATIIVRQVSAVHPVDGTPLTPLLLEIMRSIWPEFYAEDCVARKLPSDAVINLDKEVPCPDACAGIVIPSNSGTSTTDSDNLSTASGDGAKSSTAA